MTSRSTPNGWDWDDVRFFLAAADEGGFGAAARRLGTQQSTVSRRVASLEAELGAALFERTATGLVITALGARVRAAAEEMAGAALRVRDLAASEVSAIEGLVRIATTETVASVLIVPRVLPPLLARHPGLSIDLVVSDTAADLARREADVAVRFFRTPSGDLVTKRVARLETAVAASPAIAGALASEPVARWPFVDVSLPIGDTPEDAWRHAHAGRTARLSTTSFHTQLEAVRAGLGVAILPAELATALGLVALPLPDGVPPPPALDTFLVVPRTLRDVPRVLVVTDALTAARRGLAA
ncbi:LysR family transcriptional regulator, partial [Myxococcota bacterium]|nr:LysR family transcriptional regulator [Myxococcota bacterium]